MAVSAIFTTDNTPRVNMGNSTVSRVTPISSLIMHRPKERITRKGVMIRKMVYQNG